MNNEILLNRKNDFVSRFGKETDEIKEQVHYQSVLNMTDTLLLLKNKKESEPHKQSICTYIDEMINLSFPIDKLTSSKQFNSYLFPVSKYLMYKADFTSNADFQRIIGFGILLDIVVFWMAFSKLGFYLPIFTVIFTIKGIRKKRSAITNNRYFNTYY